MNNIGNVKFNSTSGMPNSYDYINNLATNPVVLIIITVTMVGYYFLFNSLGISNSKTSNSNSSNSSISLSFLESLMWGIFILLLLLNGTRYFFGITAEAGLDKLLSNDPSIDITIHDPSLKKPPPPPPPKPAPTPPPRDPEIKIKEEVFHIPDNKYSYDDAKALCKAYDARLSTYEEMEEAYNNGAGWCSYGWTDGQLALFPTQIEKWDKLQKYDDTKNFCGRPGINGGYIANKNVKFGVNCYGHKPKMNTLEGKLMSEGDHLPKSKKEELFEQKVAEMKAKTGNIRLAPFNDSTWSKI